MKKSRVRDVTPILQTSSENYFESTKDIIELQMRTLAQLNNRTFEEYQKTETKIKALKEENAKNYGVLEEVFKYCLQIEDISKEIDAIEAKEDKLSKYLDKLEIKFKELSTIEETISVIKEKQK